MTSPHFPPYYLLSVFAFACPSYFYKHMYVHISLYTYAHMIPVSPSCYCRWSCWWQIFNFLVVIIYIVYPCLCCILLVDRHSLTLGLAVQPVSASKTLIPFCWQCWGHSFEHLVTTEASFGLRRVRSMNSVELENWAHLYLVKSSQSR